MGRDLSEMREQATFNLSRSNREASVAGSGEGKKRR